MSLEFAPDFLREFPDPVGQHAKPALSQNVFVGVVLMDIVIRVLIRGMRDGRNWCSIFMMRFWRRGLRGGKA